MVNAIKVWLKQQKIKRYAKKMRASVRVLEALDKAFIKAGYPRQARRDFWRRVAVNPSLARQVVEDLIASRVEAAPKPCLESKVLGPSRRGR